MDKMEKLERSPKSNSAESLVDMNRLNNLSDGVFAIAMTLLALELRVPRGTDGAHLAHELLELWPSYAAFLTSFVTIGIIWLNHHRLFALIRCVDSRLLLCNTLLLLIVTAVSFPTSLVAEYVTMIVEGLRPAGGGRVLRPDIA